MCKGVTQMYKPLTDKDGKLFYILDEDAAEEMLDLQDEAVECVETMIDALNYLAQFGWRFAQAYVVPRGTRDEVGGTTYWILYKDVDDYSQISEGFTTRRQQRGN